MPRLIYTLLFYLCLPLIIGRLIHRAVKAPAYARRWRERFGFFHAPKDNSSAIWVHTVSVGETIAAAPLVKALQQQYPEHRFIVTTMTPTGSEQVKAIYGDKVFHIYAPYDLPDAVNRFLTKLKPELAIVMETELWPNTIAACRKRNIPVFLTNARLSERSFKSYGKLGSLTRSLLQNMSYIAAQDRGTAERFSRLGCPGDRLQVTGTLKYDISISEDLKAEGLSLRTQWLKGRSENAKIIIAASTHDGEDLPILHAFLKIRQQHPETLLILVPRHPERFNDVGQLIAEQGLQYSRRSSGDIVTDTSAVLLGDTMGEMLKLYGAADIAFIGGSLVASGGHNMLEPAAFGLPILSGPHLFNFQDVSSNLIKAGAMQVIHNKTELGSALMTLLQDQKKRNIMAEAATQTIEDNRGALNKQIQIANTLLRNVNGPQTP